jgi:hypothetical protein
MRSTATLTKAPTPATTIAPTLGKAAPATILYPDFGDRIRALQKTATLAAMGSPAHWRRLRRLDPSVKQVLWHSLSPEQRAALKLRAASLDGQGQL